MGARFGFEPFAPVVLEIPILPELPVEAEEMGAVEENTDPAEVDPEENTDPVEADNTEPKP